MSTNIPVAPVARCDCHGWHPVANLASWFHRTGPQHVALVRDWAQSGIWEVGRCRLSHAEMTGLIRAAGGITCDHALDARRLLSGEIELVNGLHRWAVADELGVDVVPVKMSVETESPFAW